MESNERLLVVGLLFLFIFISGFVLGYLSKPYNVFLITIHKLIGLAAGVFLGMAVYQRHQVTPLGSGEIAAIVVTILLFVGTVAAGGLQSIERPMPAAVSWVHKLTPYLAVLSTGATLYLLQGAK